MCVLKLKTLFAKLDAPTRALCISVAWLLGVELLAIIAWDGGLFTRQEALAHWLLLGVLPPAMALWSMPARRRG